MNACEMFQKMSPELAATIVAWLRDSERDVYRSALSTLANQRKLRPQFVSKKSVADQSKWIVDQLKLKLNEAIGENLLQIWLMKSRSTMLVTFLNALSVPHDGNGGVEGDIPATFPEGKVNAGVEELLSAHPPEEVAAYLNLFQLQQPGGWEEITAALADPRLQFKGAA